MSEPSTVVAPPRLLTGVALLYWGAVTGHSLVGLLCAFVVEARWWVDMRWEAGERGFVRAWHLSFLLGILALAWVWLMGENVFDLFGILIWAPVLLLPVIIAQQYSVEGNMPLNTFSLVARRKMLMDRKEGRPVNPVMVHVGYSYLFLVMIASTLANPKPQGWVSLVAIGLVGVAALFFASPLSRLRPVAWTVTVLAAAGIGIAGIRGMEVLYDLLNGSMGASTGMETTGDESLTAIGSIGEIKRNNRIYWRMGGMSPKPFGLLRVASYNRYRAGIWNHRPAERIPRAFDYEPLTLGGDQNLKIWAFRREDLAGRTGRQPGLSVRGEAREKTPLPMPENAEILSDLKVDGVEWNPLGTVVAVNPDHGVIDFRVETGDENLIDSDPNNDLDLHVPPGEREVLQEICEELGLEGQSSEEIVGTLKKFFRKDFRYSLDLGKGVLSNQERMSALMLFLRVNRTGHCEYYATAATLLLRRAGVPARYVQGFSVQERDLVRNEWVLRGSHAHAWCRAYVGGTRGLEVQDDGTEKVVWTGGRWIDVDTTPPTWFAMEGSEMSWGRVLLDVLQRWREDFLLWRVQPGNRLTVNLVMIALGALLVWVILRRVWRLRVKRRRREIVGGRGGGEDVEMTPLHALERHAEPWLGVRPAGVALTRWLGGLATRMPDARASLQSAVALHWKARFDPLGSEDGERERLDALCLELRRMLKSGPREPDGRGS